MLESVVSQSRLCIDITQTDSIYVYNLRCKQIKLKIQSAIVLQLELSNSIHQTTCVHSRNVCSAITFQRTDTVHQTGGRNSKRRPTIEHPTFEGECEVPDGIRDKGGVAGAGQYRDPRESTPRPVAGERGHRAGNRRHAWILLPRRETP